MCVIIIICSRNKEIKVNLFPVISNFPASPVSSLSWSDLMNPYSTDTAFVCGKHGTAPARRLLFVSRLTDPNRGKKTFLNIHRHNLTRRQVFPFKNFFFSFLFFFVLSLSLKEANKNEPGSCIRSSYREEPDKLCAWKKMLPKTKCPI